MTTEIDEERDGRRLRKARHQEAVVDAMLELLAEGHLRPSAREIADRAGVSLRSVFRHFADLDALFSAAVRRRMQRVAASYEFASPAGSLDDRIRAVVRYRVSLYEEIAPVRRAATLEAPFREPVQRALDLSHRTLRHQLVTTFDPELLNRPAKDRRVLLEALDVICGWSTWDTLRTTQSLTALEAEPVLEQMLFALLADDPAS